MHKRNCSASNSSTASASSFVAGVFGVASDGFSEKRSSGTVCIYMVFHGIIGSSFERTTLL